MTDTERPAAAQENTLARIGFEAFAQHFASNFGAGEKPVWENGKNSPAIEELRECIVVAARAIATAAAPSPSAEREIAAAKAIYAISCAEADNAERHVPPFDQLDGSTRDIYLRMARAVFAATPSSENGMSAALAKVRECKNLMFLDDGSPCVSEDIRAAINEAITLLGGELP